MVNRKLQYGVQVAEEDCDEFAHWGSWASSAPPGTCSEPLPEQGLMGARSQRGDQGAWRWACTPVIVFPRAGRLRWQPNDLWLRFLAATLALRAHRPPRTGMKEVAVKHSTANGERLKGRPDSTQRQMNREEIFLAHDRAAPGMACPLDKGQTKREMGASP